LASLGAALVPLCTVLASLAPLCTLAYHFNLSDTVAVLGVSLNTSLVDLVVCTVSLLVVSALLDLDGVVLGFVLALVSPGDWSLAPLAALVGALLAV